MPAPVLDFWFDFASTYSYPAAMRIGPLAEQAGVEVRFRPFLLGPIFKAQGWTTSPFNLYPAKGRHMWRDLERLCADLGLAVPASRSVSAKQPAGGPRRARRPRHALGRRFLSRGLPRGIRRRPPDRRCRGHRRRACGLQIDPRPVLAAAQSDAIKMRLRSETEAAQQLGLFGAPSFTTADGELFWGNDRLEHALRWAKRANSDVGRISEA